MASAPGIWEPRPQIARHLGFSYSHSGGSVQFQVAGPGMREWAAGIMGGVLGALFTVAIWLTWPLPDPEPDWRGEFQQLVAEENCFWALIALGRAGSNEPDAVAEFANQLVGNIDCGNPEDNAQLPEFWELLDEFIAQGYQNEQDWVRPGFGVLAANWADFQRVGEFRDRAGLMPYTFATLHQSFRCHPLNIQTRANDWYFDRKSAFAVSGEVEHLIPAWQDRIGECERAFDRMVVEAETLFAEDPTEQREYYRELVGMKAIWLGRLVHD